MGEGEGRVQLYAAMGTGRVSGSVVGVAVGVVEGVGMVEGVCMVHEGVGERVRVRVRARVTARMRVRATGDGHRPDVGQREEDARRALLDLVEARMLAERALGETLIQRLDGGTRAARR